MRTTTLIMAAGALLISPASILAQPGHGGGAGGGGPHATDAMGPMSNGPAAGGMGQMGHMSSGSKAPDTTTTMSNGHRDPSPTTAPGNGQFQGKGYAHSNTGQAKGQPNQSCEELGTTPGHAANSPGGGSPFSGEESKSGTHYAGSQLQNSRNSASVSQYDTACANQPH